MEVIQMKKDVVKFVMVLAAIATLIVAVLNVDKIMTISNGLLNMWILIVLFDFVILTVALTGGEE